MAYFDVPANVKAIFSLAALLFVSLAKIVIVGNNNTNTSDNIKENRDFIKFQK